MRPDVFGPEQLVLYSRPHTHTAHRVLSPALVERIWGQSNYFLTSDPIRVFYSDPNYYLGSGTIMRTRF